MTEFSIQQRLDILTRLASLQLFFIGGAPRSGTTWLQHLLDGIPAVSCAGEGFFSLHYANPLDRLIEHRRQTIDAKNQKLFAHTGGYPLPDLYDADTLLGTGILLALQRLLVLREDKGAGCAALGEKTPENVFVFARLLKLFPSAKLLFIARDPRDSLASSWHMFQRDAAAEKTIDAKRALIERSIPSYESGLREALRLLKEHPGQVMILTYEALALDTRQVLETALQFLGIKADQTELDTAISRASFETMSGGRKPGQTDENAFLRKGVPQGWADTLDPELAREITERLAWAYEQFQWPVA